MHEPREAHCLRIYVRNYGLRFLRSHCFPMNRLALLAFLAWLFLQSGIASSVRAGMIIDPSLGSVLFDGTSGADDDFAIQISFASPFRGRLFGIERPVVFAADNGNLNFDLNSSYYPSDENSTARISPFWDDFLFQRGLPNRITAFHAPGSFLAVSWVNAHLFFDEVFGGVFPGTDRSFQALWMESDVSIRGFDFKRDDIAFSYVGHVAGTSNFGDQVFARVSLDDGNGDGIGGRTAVLPGSENGGILFGDGDLLPWQTDQFLLFRWNESIGNYDVSTKSLTAIPEPSSLILVLGFAAVGGVGKLGKRMFGKKAMKSQASVSV